MGQGDKLSSLAIPPSRVSILEEMSRSPRKAKAGGRGPLKKPPKLGCVQSHVGAPHTTPSSSDVPGGGWGRPVLPSILVDYESGLGRGMIGG